VALLKILLQPCCNRKTSFMPAKLRKVKTEVMVDVEFADGRER
jgi:hypothetical protein